MNYHFAVSHQLSSLAFSRSRLPLLYMPVFPGRSGPLHNNFPLLLPAAAAPTDRKSVV